MATYYQFRTIPNSNNKLATHPDFAVHNACDMLEGKVELAELVFKVTKGFEKFDFLETELPGVFLCSPKVISALSEHNVTGWKATPVILEYKKERVPTPYYIFHVQGKSGFFDYSKSEIVDPATYSFVELKGRYFDDDTVNTDIFVVDKTVMIFVNEKVHKLMSEKRFTNMVFTPNSEIVSAVSTQHYNANVSEEYKQPKKKPPL